MAFDPYAPYGALVDTTVRIVGVLADLRY